jgi:hypothetical protein
VADQKLPVSWGSVIVELELAARTQVSTKIEITWTQSTALADVKGVVSREFQ